MPEMINHPKHYQNKAGYEVLDITDKLGITPIGHLNNALDYLLRYHKKNGLEDVKKARWYLNRFIDKEMHFTAIRHFEWLPKCEVNPYSVIEDFEIPDCTVRMSIVYIIHYFYYRDNKYIRMAKNVLDDYIGNR